jgi:hypothetical protein
MRYVSLFYSRIGEYIDSWGGYKYGYIRRKRDSYFVLLKWQFYHRFIPDC